MLLMSVLKFTLSVFSWIGSFVNFSEFEYMCGTLKWFRWNCWISGRKFFGSRSNQVSNFRWFLFSASISALNYQSPDPLQFREMETCFTISFFEFWFFYEFKMLYFALFTLFSPRTIHLMCLMDVAWKWIHLL